MSLLRNPLTGEVENIPDEQVQARLLEHWQWVEPGGIPAVVQLGERMVRTEVSPEQFRANPNTRYLTPELEAALFAPRDDLERTAGQRMEMQAVEGLAGVANLAGLPVVGNIARLASGGASAVEYGQAAAEGGPHWDEAQRVLAAVSGGALQAGLESVSPLAIADMTAATGANLLRGVHPEAPDASRPFLRPKSLAAAMLAPWAGSTSVVPFSAEVGGVGERYEMAMTGLQTSENMYPNAAALGRAAGMTAQAVAGGGAFNAVREGGGQVAPRAVLGGWDDALGAFANSSVRSLWSRRINGLVARGAIRQASGEAIMQRLSGDLAEGVMMMTAAEVRDSRITDTPLTAERVAWSGLIGSLTGLGVAGAALGIPAAARGVNNRLRGIQGWSGRSSTDRLVQEMLEATDVPEGAGNRLLEILREDAAKWAREAAGEGVPAGDRASAMLLNIGDYVSRYGDGVVGLASTRAVPASAWGRSMEWLAQQLHSGPRALMRFMSDPVNIVAANNAESVILRLGPDLEASWAKMGEIIDEITALRQNIGPETWRALADAGRVAGRTGDIPNFAVPVENWLNDSVEALWRQVDAVGSTVVSTPEERRILDRLMVAVSEAVRKRGGTVLPVKSAEGVRRTLERYQLRGSKATAGEWLESLASLQFTIDGLAAKLAKDPQALERPVGRLITALAGPTGTVTSAASGKPLTSIRGLLNNESAFGLAGARWNELEELGNDLRRRRAAVIAAFGEAGVGPEAEFVGERALRELSADKMVRVMLDSGTERGWTRARNASDSLLDLYQRVGLAAENPTIVHLAANSAGSDLGGMAARIRASELITEDTRKTFMIARNHSFARAAQHELTDVVNKVGSYKPEYALFPIFGYIAGGLSSLIGGIPGAIAGTAVVSGLSLAVARLRAPHAVARRQTMLLTSIREAQHQRQIYKGVIKEMIETGTPPSRSLMEARFAPFQGAAQKVAAAPILVQLRGSYEDRQQALSQLHEHKSQIEQNPEALAERVDFVTQGIREVDPAIADELQVVGARAAMVIGAALPPTDIDPLTGQVRHLANQAQLDILAETLEGALNPLSMLMDIASGIITAEKANAVRAVYPSLYQEIVLDTLEAIQEGGRMGQVEAPFQLSLALSRALGMRLNAESDPTMLYRLQVHYAQTTPQEQAQRGQRGRSFNRNPGVVVHTMTTAQSMEDNR